MLIEIHILQNHAPSNLNRDDTGSPKECVFGGFKRARISSQCLKRSIRRSESFQKALDGHLATRTRRLPELVRERALKEGLSPELAEVAAKKATGFGTEKGTERPADKDKKYSTAQTMFLTESDISAVAEVLINAARAAKDVKKFEALKAADLQKEAQQKSFRAMTVDIALFGRMVTSEAFRNVEASTQVAHALSTHKVDHEFDYFTAVDDLQGTGVEEEDAGADMLGDVEYNSACYYKYISIHREGLIDNLSGANLRGYSVNEADLASASELAAETVAALLKSALTVSPSGKQNSFAAHQLPSAVLVEVRPNNVPVSYANAFVQPARPGGGNLAVDSLEKLGKHVEAVTAGFDLEASYRWLLAPEHLEAKIDGVDRVKNLRQLTEALRQAVIHGATNSPVKA